MMRKDLFKSDRFWRQQEANDRKRERNEGAKIKSDRPSREGGRSQVIANRDTGGRTTVVQHVVSDRNGEVLHRDVKKHDHRFDR